LHRGFSLAAIGVLVGVYAWVWGLGQIPAGALADRIGRTTPIALGTFLIAAGTATLTVSEQHVLWYTGVAVMGTGMALVYPNLITAVSDTAHPSWRGGALGVYRLWRDSGYAIAPLLFGAIAALTSLTTAFWTAVALMAASGLTLLILFDETEPHRRIKPPVWERRLSLSAH
jgi:MFS family permease